MSRDLSKGPDRYRELGAVWIFAPGEQLKGQFQVEDAWLHQNQLILKFDGVDSMNDAEAFRGCEVRIPFELRAPLADGEYYLSDLPGCEVLDDKSGTKVGEVGTVLELPGTNLLELTSGALIPLNREICKVIDTEHRTIRVDVPEGLLDLNRK